MARFDRIDTSKLELLDKKKCFLVKGTLTLDDVNKLNGLNKKIVLVFENTKGQNSDIIGYLNPNVIRVSVVGGIDYLHKRKYNSKDYIRRTIHSPKDIANIMKTFETIERKVMFTWTESQKCMFVYKTLCEMLNGIDSNERTVQNGVDYMNTLTGILYGRASCEGASLLFKEIMDRLGIECHYQLLDGIHAFNTVKLDGEYHGVDLYWDIQNKGENNKCGFNYYCREDGNAFYSNRYHDLSNEKEEIRYPVMPFVDEKLEEDLTLLTSNKKEYSHEMTRYTNSQGEVFDYTYLGESGGFSAFIVRNEDNINYFYISKGDDITTKLDNKTLSDACYNCHNLSGNETLPTDIKRFSRFIREDGTNFIVCPTGKTYGDNIMEYTMLEPQEIDGKKVLRKTVITSENDFIFDKDANFRYSVANYLLSRNRLENRLKNYGGYVGFASHETRKLFEMQDERDIEVVMPKAA